MVLKSYQKHFSGYKKKGIICLKVGRSGDLVTKLATEMNIKVRSPKLESGSSRKDLTTTTTTTTIYSTRNRGEKRRGEKETSSFAEDKMESPERGRRMGRR